MKDSFGRNINYLRISITDLCNLRCKYCMPEEGVQKECHNNILSLEDFYKVSKVMVGLGINKIRITGGEPLIKKDIVSLIEKIAKLEGIKEVALTTNGLLLEKYAEELKKAGLTRVNISIDTLDEKKYSEITRGGKLTEVLKGIEKAKEVGLTPIKLNVVLMGGFNVSEISNFVELTRNEKMDIRFIELMPIGEALKIKNVFRVDGNTILEKVPELKEVEREDRSSPAKYFKLENGLGKVGIIEPVSCKFCKDCNRIRLTSTGKLKLCLHSEDEIDLKPYLGDEEKLKKAILESIKIKPEEHLLEEGQYVQKSMSKIGG